MNYEQGRFDKRNLLFVIYKLSIKGGAERVLVEVCNQLVPKFNIVIVSWDKNEDISAYGLDEQVTWHKI